MTPITNQTRATVAQLCNSMNLSRDERNGMLLHYSHDTTTTITGLSEKQAQKFIKESTNHDTKH